MQNKSDIFKILIFFLVILSLIFSYGNFRCKNPDYRDPLMRKLGILDLDGWSITHFLTYMLITYIFPDYWVLIAVMGVSWEVFEQVLGSSRPGWLGGFGNCATTDPNVKEWWFGRLSDIVINFMGMSIGYYLAKRK